MIQNLSMVFPISSSYTKHMDFPRFLLRWNLNENDDDIGNSFTLNLGMYYP